MLPRRHSSDRVLPVAGSTVASPPVISALTGIRAVAALAVLAYHGRQMILDLLPSVKLVDPWLVFAFLGVDVFFVLSGFIISYNYAERLATLDRRRYRDFMAARFARIYPVHLVMLLVTAAVIVWFRAQGWTYDWRPHTLGGFVGNVFMLQALPGVPPWNGPSWSVSCEAAAYVVFPFIAGLLVRLRPWTALGLAVGFAVLFVVGIAVLLAGDVFLTAPFNGVRIAAEFSIGCLLWAFWRHGTRPSWRWDVVAVGAVVAAALVLVLSGVSAPAFIAVAFLALFVMATASASGPVRWVLTSRPLQWGGRVSYSVYLVHYPFVEVSDQLLPRGADVVGAALLVRLALVVAFFMVAIGAGALVYYVVEEPARRWLRRRSRRREPARRDAGRSPQAPHDRDEAAVVLQKPAR